MSVNKTSYTLGFLLPNQVSQQRLSTGVYSLSARSNIPFARLIGKGVDKTFTWGETVEVPPGMLCTIANASSHAGDLFINSGCDLDNRPARITVPVPYNMTAFDPGIGGNLFIAPYYPADVRCARRAYLCPSIRVGGINTVEAIVFGTRTDGSLNTISVIQGLTGSPGTGYVTLRLYPLSTMINIIPLGHQVLDGDDTRPHTLLSNAFVWLQNTYIGQNVANEFGAYYVMEY